MNLLRNTSLLILIFLIYSGRNCYGQIKLTEGAGLIIHSGTQLTLHSYNDSLQLTDSSTILNNGIILFKNQSLLLETPNYPITGSGHEIAEVDTLMAGMNNPSNLGMKLQLSSPSSYRKIYRYHSDTLTPLNGYAAVKRYFQIQPTIVSLGSTIYLQTDSTELNGLNPSQLKLVSLNSSPINLGGILDNDSLQVSQISDSITTFTLSSSSISVDSLQDINICHSDSVHLNFNTNGFINPGAEFILFLANSSDTIVLDTVVNIGSSAFLMDTTIPSGNYVFFAWSSDLNMIDSSDNSIQINSNPIISFNSSMSACYTSDSLLLSNALPTGGNYSGNFVANDYFHPALSGVGNFQFYYSIVDANGCSDHDSTMITIYSLPVVNFSSLPSICNNESPYLLTEGTPNGGVYTGTGINGTDFDPALLNGTYLLTYLFTDTNNCSASDTSSILVLDAPTVPLISQNVNQLSSTPATTYQWYLNGTPISGANSATYDAVADGQYQVEVTNGNSCSEISAPLNFSYNSIQVGILEQQIQIYPNPASEYFQIQTTYAGELLIRFNDSNGKNIYEGTINGQAFVNIQDYPNGIYFLECYHEEFQKTIKLVIAR